MPPDPIRSATEGATMALLRWSKQEIRSLVQRFKNREIAFVENPSTVAALIEEKKGPEYQLYRHYVKDSKFRILCLMGLTLRKLEGTDGLETLRNKIYKKHDEEGLHVAQAVQSGILGILIQERIKDVGSEINLSRELDAILRGVEQSIEFVQLDDDSKRKAHELAIRIHAQRPRVLVVAGLGGAKVIAERVVKGILQEVKDYAFRKYEDTARVVLLLVRKPKK